MDPDMHIKFGTENQQTNCISSAALKKKKIIQRLQVSQVKQLQRDIVAGELGIQLVIASIRWLLIPLKAMVCADFHAEARTTLERTKD